MSMAILMQACQSRNDMPFPSHSCPSAHGHTPHKSQIFPSHRGTWDQVRAPDHKGCKCSPAFCGMTEIALPLKSSCVRLGRCDRVATSDHKLRPFSSSASICKSERCELRDLQCQENEVCCKGYLKTSRKQAADAAF